MGMIYAQTTQNKTNESSLKVNSNVIYDFLKIYFAQFYMESASWPKNIVENLLQKSGMRHFIHIQHFNFTFNLHIYVI